MSKRSTLSVGHQSTHPERKIARLCWPVLHNLSKVVKEAEKELREAAEKRQKDGKDRLTRVVNLQPSSGGKHSSTDSMFHRLRGRPASKRSLFPLHLADAHARVVVRGLGDVRWRVRSN